jgi:hypothetical protein
LKNCPKRNSKSQKCRARRRTERKGILESELIVVKTQKLSKKFQKTSQENKSRGHGEDTNNDLIASLEKFSFNKSFQNNQMDISSKIKEKMSRERESSSKFGKKEKA